TAPARYPAAPLSARAGTAYPAPEINPATRAPMPGERRLRSDAWVIRSGNALAKFAHRSRWPSRDEAEYTSTRAPATSERIRAVTSDGLGSSSHFRTHSASAMYRYAHCKAASCSISQQMLSVGVEMSTSTIVDSRMHSSTARFHE